MSCKRRKNIYKGFIHLTLEEKKMEKIKRKINILRSKNQKIENFFKFTNENTNKNIEKIFSSDKKTIPELKKLLDLLKNKDVDDAKELIVNGKKQLKNIKLFLDDNDLTYPLEGMTRYGKSYQYKGEEFFTKLKILHNIHAYLKNINIADVIYVKDLHYKVLKSECNELLSQLDSIIKFNDVEIKNRVGKKNIAKLIAKQKTWKKQPEKIESFFKIISVYSEKKDLLIDSIEYFIRALILLEASDEEKIKIERDELFKESDLKNEINEVNKMGYAINISEKNILKTINKIFFIEKRKKELKLEELKFDLKDLKIEGLKLESYAKEKEYMYIKEEDIYMAIKKEYDKKETLYIKVKKYKSSEERREARRIKRYNRRGVPIPTIYCRFSVVQDQYNRDAGLD